jgi:hypothetical protein
MTLEKGIIKEGESIDGGEIPVGKRRKFNIDKCRFRFF